MKIETYRRDGCGKEWETCPGIEKITLRAPNSTNDKGADHWFHVCGAPCYIAALRALIDSFASNSTAPGSSFWSFDPARGVTLSPVALIPTPIRKALGVERGGPLCFLDKGGGIVEVMREEVLDGRLAADPDPIASSSLVPLDRDVVEAWISEASAEEVEEIRIACSRRADGPTPGDPRLVVLVREAVRLLGHVAAIPTGPVDSARCILAEALTLYGSTPEPPR